MRAWGDADSGALVRAGQPRRRPSVAAPRRSVYKIFQPLRRTLRGARALSLPDWKSFGGETGVCSAPRRACLLIKEAITLTSAVDPLGKRRIASACRYRWG